jgi:NAD(P)-dependent dehydrogenase (short-subunit alcohol dehydrogenase family)
LKNKILISGASSELALKTITNLSKKNNLICITSKKEKLSKKLKNLKPLIIEQRGSNISEIIDTLEKKKVSINSIIHFNGYHNFNLIQNVSKNLFDEFFNTNCFSFVNLLQLTKNQKITKNLHSIVTISSVSSFHGSKGISLYAASKAALNSIVKSAAIELSTRKIRVNSIVLGHINKGMGAKVNKFLNSKQIKDLENKHPLGFGNDVDLFNCINFLIDKNKSKWITGTNLVLDGGYLI